LAFSINVGSRIACEDGRHFDLSWMILYVFWL
jgi:hypothetical protein